MDAEDREFFEWADAAGIEPDRENLLSWRAGRASMAQAVAMLKQETKRLSEIITERNHDMGLG